MLWPEFEAEPIPTSYSRLGRQHRLGKYDSVEAKTFLPLFGIGLEDYGLKSAKKFFILYLFQAQGPYLVVCLEPNP